MGTNLDINNIKINLEYLWSLKAVRSTLSLLVDSIGPTYTLDNARYLFNRVNSIFDKEYITNDLNNNSKISDIMRVFLPTRRIDTYQFRLQNLHEYATNGSKVNIILKDMGGKHSQRRK